MLLPTKIPEMSISIKDLESVHKCADFHEQRDNGYSCRAVYGTPDGLFKDLLIMQFLTGAQAKPMLREVWQGTGCYTITFCMGASQEQDVFKQDDTWLDVVYKSM